MGKSVKISEPVYEQLQQMQRPRESISDVIRRLLAIYHDVHGLVKRIHGDNIPPGSYLEG